MTLLNAKSSARPARACGALVDRVRGRVARKGGATAGELSQYAAAAFEAYAETLLRALMAAASRREGDDVEAWVRRQFHDGLDNAGTPLGRPSPNLRIAMRSRRDSSRRCSKPN